MLVLYDVSRRGRVVCVRSTSRPLLNGISLFDENLAFRLDFYNQSRPARLALRTVISNTISNTISKQAFCCAVARMFLTTEVVSKIVAIIVYVPALFFQTVDEKHGRGSTIQDTSRYAYIVYCCSPRLQPSSLVVTANRL